LYDELEAIRLRRKDEFERDVALAWHVEALRRQKALPKLERLLATQVKQSAKEQRQMLQILSAQYKIPLKEHKRAPLRVARG
jgi:hypothetical protein